MLVLKEHILPILSSMVQNPDSGFDDIVKFISNPNKGKAKKLLLYLDKLLNWHLDSNSEDLEYVHIHFDDINDDLIDVVFEFIVVKLFFYGLTHDVKKSKGYLSDRIAALSARIGSSLHDKNGLSAKSLRFKKLVQEREKLQKLKQLLERLQTINPKASFEPFVIVQTLQKQRNCLHNEKAQSPFCIPMEQAESNKNYVLVNSDIFLDDIDGTKIGDEHLIDQIKHLVVFDCDQKSISREFNYKKLSEWNKSGSTFKSLILLTFDTRNFRFDRLKNRLERISTRYYSQTSNPHFFSYTILPFETKFLLGEKSSDTTEVNFFGEEECIFWDSFKEAATFYEGLYELRSLKLMNIYSLVVNERLKRLVVDTIFSDTPSTLLTKETWQTLVSLPQRNQLELKESLENTLDWIINLGWKARLSQAISRDATLVVSDLAAQSETFKKEFRNALNLGQGTTITSWAEAQTKKWGPILVLCYRDLGPYPYSIYPNIYENGFDPRTKTSVLFLKCFFESLLHWNFYDFNRALTKICGHPRRIEKFAWNTLSEGLKALRPSSEVAVSWQDELVYFGESDRVTFKVKFFKSSKYRVFNSSEPFIYSREKGGEMRVASLSCLADLLMVESELYAQRLEDLYAEGNLYEAMADFTKENSALKVIRDKFNLPHSDSPVKLWKELLSRANMEKGVDQLYQEISIALERKGRKIVSKDHFISVWLNPESNSMVARGNTVFKTICEYLGLSRDYISIAFRIYNSEKLARSKSSQKMNRLLSDLFNHGCFDDDVELRAVLNDKASFYTRNHDLESIGISTSSFDDGIIALIELLKPNINLIKIDQIEIN
jgi:hypothetical protein